MSTLGQNAASHSENGPSTQAPTLESFSDSQVRILLAAERLFAQSSIESVSLREIATEAEQRNNYAVQYHFGSREGLANALFTYRMLQMEERRARMLADAERNDRLHDMRTLLDMVFLPQLDLQDADGNHSYANFLCQFLMRRRFQEFGDFGMPSPPNLDRVLKLLRVRLGYLPKAVAQRRLVGASLVFLNILVTHDEENSKDAGESFEDALEDTMKQIELALTMPFTTEEDKTP